MISIDICLDRPSKTYCSGDSIVGTVNIKSKTEARFEEIFCQLEGASTVHLSPKNSSLLEAVSKGIREFKLATVNLVKVSNGKLEAGDNIYPFSHALCPSFSEPLFETYHGVYLAVRYEIKACVRRSFPNKDLEKVVEFIVEDAKYCSYSEPVGEKPLSFTMTPSSVQDRTVSGSGLPKFCIQGSIDSTACLLGDAFTGEMEIIDCSVPIKSLELQLVRVETCGSVETGAYSKDLTEIQNIQIGDGDVPRRLVIPIYMIFPRLFTCPSLVRPNFRIQFQVNVCVVLQGDHVITEAIPRLQNTAMLFAAARKEGLMRGRFAATFGFWLRCYSNSTSTAATNPNGSCIRNVGIMAHIDAGIDPVERSLRVVEGAIAVLDASAGVEAQTLNVWRQAAHYDIPSIIFLNKMDKPGGSGKVEMCLDSIRKKLDIVPALCQWPLFDVEGHYFGHIDLLEQTCCLWDIGTDGKTFRKIPLFRFFKTSESANCEVTEKTATEARETLLAVLADFDEDLANDLLSEVPSQNKFDLKVEAIFETRLVVCWVFLGSAAENIGIQPLLDALGAYLPGPFEEGVRKKQTQVHFYEPHLCALAFKITHDSQEQSEPLTFVRVYSGSISPKSAIFNVNQHITEHVSKVYKPYADESQEISRISAGNIAVVSGLKLIRSGETLTDSLKSAKLATARAAAVCTDKDSGALKPILAGIEPEEPLFFCSLEPPNSDMMEPFERALENLTREDPSLRVRRDPESQQYVVEAMGSLHVDVITERLKKDYHLDVFRSQLMVNYRETVLSSAKESFTIDEKIGGKQNFCHVSLSVCPKIGAGLLNEASISKAYYALWGPTYRDHVIKWRATLWSAESFGCLEYLRACGPLGACGPTVISPDCEGLPWVLNLVLEGIKQGAEMGPILGYPLRDIFVVIETVLTRHGVSKTVINACAKKALARAVLHAQCSLIEPIVALDITVPAKHFDALMVYLVDCGAIFYSESGMLQDEVGDNVEESSRKIYARAPLSQLTDLSAHFRKLTSGLGSVHMEPHGYEVVSKHRERELVEKLKII